MIKALLPMRKCDDFGCGHFGAARGGRKHNGVDLSCYPGTKIFPIVRGIVTKIGYPYPDNPRTEYNEMNYRYVRVKDEQGREWDYYYVEPYVEVNDYVSPTNPIGEAQDLRIVYGDELDKLVEKMREGYEPSLEDVERLRKAITNHVHIQVKQNGEYMNPEDIA